MEKAAKKELQRWRKAVKMYQRSAEKSKAALTKIIKDKNTTPSQMKLIVNISSMS